MNRPRLLVVASALLLVVVGVAAYLPTLQSDGAALANFVLSQPSLASLSSNANSIGQIPFTSPLRLQELGKDVDNAGNGIAIDAFGRIYVADAANTRVLVYNPDGDTTAEFVANMPPVDSSVISGDTVYFNYSLAVVTTGNTTVLFTRAPFFSTSNNTSVLQAFNIPALTSNYPSTPATEPRLQPSDTLLVPGLAGGMAVGSVGGSWRLYYVVSGSAQIRSRTITIGSDNLGAAGTDTYGGLGTSSTLLSASPRALAISPAGDRLFIADNGNNRVVVESLTDGDTIFDGVFGQPNFTSGAQASSYSRTQLIGPRGLAISRGGRNLAVHSLIATTGDTRHVVLIFSDTAGVDTVAKAVIGDSDFASPGVDLGQVTGRTINDTNTFSLAFSPTDLGLYVFHTVGSRISRVIRFPSRPETVPGIPASAIQTETSPTDTTATVAVIPTTGSDSYVQINLSNGGTTSGTLSTATNEAGTGANYSISTTLANLGDTATINLWTNQSGPTMMISTRTDTANLTGLPTGISDNDTGRRAFGAAILGLELVNSFGQLLGDTITKINVGDTFAYSLIFNVSPTTTSLYRSLGFDTATGSGSFRFWVAPTYTSAWVATSFPVTVTQRADGGLRLIVTGITQDLHGGLGGVPSGASASGGDGGTCAVVRSGFGGWFLDALRSLRDLLLASAPMRLLVSMYYGLAG